MENTNILKMSSFLTHLSTLIGLPLFVYGEKGELILPPTIEDKFLSFLMESPEGMEYSNFIKGCIEKTIHRRDISIFIDSKGHHHFFIPIRIENVIFVIAGGIYFPSKEPEDTGSQNIMKDYATVQETARHIQSLFDLFLSSSYEGSLNKKRYQLTKTILSLISDIELEKQADEVYDILVDILLFLFNADSVTVMVKGDDIFRTQRAVGRMKGILQSFSLHITGIVSEVLDKQRPLYSEDLMEILQLGLSDEVVSVYIFPIVSGDKVTKLLGICNSSISQEDIDIIAELCRIIGCILRLIELRGNYEKRKKEIDLLSSTTYRLNEIREPEMLYETIMESSVHLTDAERGSLMLVEDGTSYLAIKAAKGINRKLLKEIKIKVGEGIAGKVFEKGAPIIVHDIEKDEKFLLRRKPSYRTGSFISIPLKAGEKTLGVLNISDKMTGEVFSEEDMAILSYFASYASVALERSLYYSLVAHLKELSITDSLTGLYNKRYFEERFFEEQQRSERYNLTFSLAMLDIDDFKLFNDTEGHLAGDRLLKNIATIAKENLRFIDIIARFGGEEFAIIMPVTEKDEAFLVAERIRKAMKEQLPRTWKVFPKEKITITAGVATFPHDGRDTKELLRNADKALYKGKREGKDRTILFGK